MSRDVLVIREKIMIWFCFSPALPTYSQLLPPFINLSFLDIYVKWDLGNYFSPQLFPWNCICPHLSEGWVCNKERARLSVSIYHGIYITVTMLQLSSYEELIDSQGELNAHSSFKQWEAEPPDFQRQKIWDWLKYRFSLKSLYVWILQIIFFFLENLVIVCRLRASRDLIETLSCYVILHKWSHFSGP